MTASGICLKTTLGIYVGVVVETLVFRMQIIINYKSLFHLLPVLS